MANYRRRLGIYVFAMLSMAGSFTVADDGVDWLRSAQQAAEASAETGKPILIYVRSETCHYCDLMQKDVWQDPTTAALIHRDFIPLKLTREENKEGVAAMKVKGYPCTLVFSAERKFVGRIDGYVNAAQFQKNVENLRLTAAEKDGGIRR